MNLPISYQMFVPTTPAGFENSPMFKFFHTLLQMKPFFWEKIQSFLT